MNFQSLRKPVPIWFYFLRFVAVIAGLIWLGYDGNFKPLGQALAGAVSEVTTVVHNSKILDEVAAQSASAAVTQQPTNGAAK